MKERDYPEGHPASADYDPDSPEAKAFAQHQADTATSRDYPKGHPSAPDSPAEKVGDGYKSFVAPDETSVRAGGMCLRSPDVLVIACPLHGERKLHSIVGQKFNRKSPVIEGDVQFPCGTTALLVDGVWRLA